VFVSNGVRIIRSGRVIESGPINKWDGYGNREFGPGNNLMRSGTYDVK